MWLKNVSDQGMNATVTQLMSIQSGSWWVMKVFLRKESNVLLPQDERGLDLLLLVGSMKV